MDEGRMTYGLEGATDRLALLSETINGGADLEACRRGIALTIDEIAQDLNELREAMDNEHRTA